MLGIGTSWLGDIDPSREGDLTPCACTVDVADELENRRAVGACSNLNGETSELALRDRVRGGSGFPSSNSAKLSVDRSESSSCQLI